MAAIDNTYERLHDDLGGIREEIRGLRADFSDEFRGLRSDLSDEIRGLRSDFSSLQDRLLQIGFGLVGVLSAALIALIVALV
jgi:hypothetical protein